MLSLWDIHEVASSSGLMVSFPKTKFMAIGSAVPEDDQQLLVVDDCLIECLSLFISWIRDCE